MTHFGLDISTTNELGEALEKSHQTLSILHCSNKHYQVLAHLVFLVKFVKYQEEHVIDGGLT